MDSRPLAHFLKVNSTAMCSSRPPCESFDPSEITRKNVTAYSPTTGTCQMSPFASPTSSKEGEHESGPSNGKRKKLNCLSLTQRKEATTKDSDEFMVLLSKVEKSSEEIMEIMQNLSSIQALEGSRELENLLGISRASCFLREMQKTKELMTKATKQKLFEKKSSGLPNKDDAHQHMRMYRVTSSRQL
nr:centromere protein R isoform X7 [Equus caballus]XP_023497761.1 centromere protein R isoform X7 [Equus caballus]